MDFAPDSIQQAVLDAVDVILHRYAGPERAREVVDEVDAALVDALSSAGYLDLFDQPDTGPLTAALVVEAVSQANGRIPAGARALVGPALLGDEVPGRIALAAAGSTGPVRWAPQAEVILVLDGDDARVVEPREVGPVESPFGFPFGLVDLEGGRGLGPGSGDVLRRWWRVAVAAEMVGAMQGALDHTVRHLTEREQFGKPLGSLQAIQHRLAEAHVRVEGARWLVRSAAWQDASGAAAALAAGHASEAARLIGTDMHQLSGAIGFTLEFDLHLWTTRLHALRLELGGASAHHRDLARAVWD